MKTHAGLITLRDEMDRWFERLWDRDAALLPANGGWTPAIDLTENKEAVVVRVDLPGIEPKDVHVDLQANVLTIRGKNEVEKTEKDETFYRMERRYGAFVRTVRMPVAVDATKVKATFKNGMLAIVLPKAAEARTAEIPVQIG
jgi:HSP20 family protein